MVDFNPTATMEKAPRHFWNCGSTLMVFFCTFVWCGAASTAYLPPERYIFGPTRVYMRDEYITIADEVEAVVGVDDYVIIKCRFGGFQPPSQGGQFWSISWTRDGSDFSLLTNFGGQIFSRDEQNKYSFVNMSDGSGECSMKIEPVTKEDQGLYEVEVNYNIALKKQIRLYMTEPAGPTGVIVNMTGDKIVQNEPKVDVNCYVFGAHPKVRMVEWLKDELVLDSSELIRNQQRNRFKFLEMGKGRFWEHYVMRILNVQRTDNGEYSCQAGNQFGNVAGNVRISISSQPNVVLKAVPSQFAKEGEKRVLRCIDTYNSVPEPMMEIEQQWDSRKLSRVVGHVASFVIHAVQRKNTGTYVCKAHNEEGKVMDATQLFVQFLDMYLLVPVIGQPNDSMEVAQDDLLFINCVVKSSPKSRITWIRLHPEEGSEVLMNESEGETELALKIQPVKKQHGGTYRCVASIQYYDGTNDTRHKDVKILVIRAPRILEIRPQPNTQGVITFNEEETARVDCVFSDGFPPSKARWTLHGKIISTVTSTTSQKGGEIIHILTLVLQNLRPNDSGKYICEVSNEENPGSFRQIQIAVKTLPQMSLSVIPLHVAVQGENRTVICTDTAQSYPPPEIYLSHSGSLGTVYKSVNHSLVYDLNNIQPHFGGIWACGAKNEVGRAQEVNTSITVHYKPVVNITSVRTKLKENEDFTAICQSRANPPATLKWIHSNTGVVLSQLDSRGEDGGYGVPGSLTSGGSFRRLMLSIPSVTSLKSGLLQCIAENEMYNGQRLSTNASINLTVLSPPKNLNLYPRRESLTVAEGGDILLKCIYNIGLPRADHHWSFTPTGKSFSTTLMKPTSISFNQGAAEMRLDIMNVTKHQSGIYMCSVWSSLYPQKMNKSISIDIIYPPSQPHIKLVTKMPMKHPDGFLKATCSANGSNPVAQISWFLDGAEVIDGVSVYTVTNESHNMATSQIELPVLRSMDGKKLWCEAHNAEFASVHAASPKLTLEVLFVPEIKYTKDAYPMSKESATIECLAHGNPTPVVKWYKASSSQPVTTDNLIKITIEANANKKKVMAKLSVTEANPTVLGTYRCEAHNSLPGSKVVEYVNMTEAVRPASPTVLRVTEIKGAHSVNISWIPPKDDSHLRDGWFQVGYQTEYSSFVVGVNYGDSSTIVTSVVEAKIPNDVREFTIKGLVPGRKYTFMVRTCNKVGCSNSDFKSIQLSFGDYKSTLVPSGRLTPNSPGGWSNPARQSDSPDFEDPQMTILEIILLLVIGCLCIALLYLLAMLMLSIRKIKVLQEKTRILDTPSFAKLPNDFVVGTNVSQKSNRVNGNSTFNRQRLLNASTGLLEEYQDSSNNFHTSF